MYGCFTDADMRVWIPAKKDLKRMNFLSKLATTSHLALPMVSETLDIVRDWTPVESNEEHYHTFPLQKKSRSYWQIFEIHCTQIWKSVSNMFSKRISFDIALFSLQSLRNWQCLHLNNDKTLGVRYLVCLVFGEPPILLDHLQATLFRHQLLPEINFVDHMESQLH